MGRDVEPHHWRSDLARVKGFNNVEKGVFRETSTLLVKTQYRGKCKACRLCLTSDPKQKPADALKHLQDKARTHLHGCAALRSR